MAGHTIAGWKWVGGKYESVTLLIEQLLCKALDDVGGDKTTMKEIISKHNTMVQWITNGRLNQQLFCCGCIQC